MEPDFSGWRSGSCSVKQVSSAKAHWVSALASLMLWAGSFLGDAAAACGGSMLSSAPSSTRCSGQSDGSPDFAKSHFPRGQLSSAPFENHWAARLRESQVTEKLTWWSCTLVTVTHRRLRRGLLGHGVNHATVPPQGCSLCSCGLSGTGPGSGVGLLMVLWTEICAPDSNGAMAFWVHWMVCDSFTQMRRSCVFLLCAFSFFSPFFFHFLMQYTERHGTFFFF